jgi:hypothetical protein
LVLTTDAAPELVGALEVDGVLPELGVEPPLEELDLLEPPQAASSSALTTASAVRLNRRVMGLS